MPEARAEVLATPRDWLRHAVSRFTEAGLCFGHGTDNAWDEAVWLLTWALSLPAGRLEVFWDARLLPKERQRLGELIDARIETRQPLAYLIHEAWLVGHRFYVDERVIVPRSFIAELLADDSLSPWLPEPPKRVLDLCTGSGCLAILAALTWPEAEVDAVDLSPEALAVAARNVADYGLAERLRLYRSDLFADLPAGTYDLILSNPPYVDAEAMAALPPEYRAEPTLALAAGDDGLTIVRRLLSEAKARLNPGGVLVVEIGHQQAVLEAAFPDLPFTWLETASGPEYVFLLERDNLPD
ncbi:MAG: 50S ribosomal protein L3 N(5)-glutamine methyltransferase [Zoogloeaceae bacterium]|nr:50S ribosomal protein L3 N(5)-glutamine methyltransferase [Zoogloeaceae bacterium]